MKCNLCGTENEYVRVLFTSVECTNEHCTNFDTKALEGMKAAVPKPKDSNSSGLDWSDIYLGLYKSD